jgi:hypothetical protein
MTARELASILAISPKTIYSYAERNMIPHFKIEASVRAYSERCRSAFRSDGDHDSKLMPITIPK